MTKLAIVDLDKVVADNTERFKRAEARREFYRQHLAVAMEDALASYDLQKPLDALLESIYWQVAFTPDLVSLDTKIPGVNDALNALLEQDYQLIFLTSRPESMKEATLEWFSLNIFIKRGANIIFKAPAFQYTKTTVWKAGMVQTLASLYSADKILFIDDEQANIDALRDSWPYETMSTLVYRVYHSLHEAIEENTKG